MEYYYLHSSELYHHGILGMKWGIRRYQNKDGSYTAEGKLRRAKNSNEDWYAPSSKAKTKKPSTTEKIKEAGQYCAKEMAKELRNCPNFAAGAGKYSTGAYNKGWSSKPQEGHSGSRYFYSYVVYNKDKYRLTHLLEKGHVIKNKSGGMSYGKVAAIPHIAPLEERWNNEFVKRCEEAVQE